ncbi:MAG: hypothetical protein ACPG74_07355 [Candidatus Puniceispirillaceae bacterium]
MNVAPDFSNASFLWPDYSGLLCLTPEGEICRPMPGELEEMLGTTTLIVCHKNGPKRGWDKRWIRLWIY